MPLPIKTGEVLRGRYKIRRVIGQGGMGCIYLADDLRLEGRNCALKEVEYDRSLPADLLREARDQFLREATVLARLDHPNLPKVSDFFSISSRDYLVMDYVPGKDLRTLILENRQAGTFLDEEEVLFWASQLCDALEYLHGQNPPILHRDIKPSNLKLTPSGLIKLVDFGLVKLAAPGEVTITVLQGQGTALYTPLEQYGGDSGHTDVRSDIYAFGATLYHLLTNHPPVDARERFLNPASLISPRQVNPSLSPRIERAILWAMALHPDERPADIRQFRSALLGDVEPISRPVPRIVRSSTRFWKRQPEQALLIASAGLLFLSFLATLAR
ncbi:MAG TPA: serine/threonine protein kinase [Anaerolinea thermolimosa]|uniref:non-specific serine/threonine protein kinase n=1 Tax=Anaerolinea thermolimosa TaxID=229919 RepID=A0A3D1JDL4_9CHLR|nr:serine/threonine-protein kinase [Anaerolinea thermolimosa]GAP07173.1 protein kinase domain [Anaerolinea thermolimosa]HCE16593.1 serine/threonine protein kinase [Anaerolinea thermolimosa]